MTAVDTTPALTFGIRAKWQNSSSIRVDIVHNRGLWPVILLVHQTNESSRGGVRHCAGGMQSKKNRHSESDSQARVVVSGSRAAETTTTPPPPG